MLVEDHAAVRASVAQRINDEPDMTVCGEAATAAEARDQVANVRPDLVVLDITLDDANGLDLIGSLTVQLPTLIVLVLSMHAEEVYAERALRAGAHGYLMKKDAARQLIPAMRCIARGDVYSSAEMRGRLQSALTEQGPLA
jgi:DNA-binding NarL/FixJ family response regulator